MQLNSIRTNYKPNFCKISKKAIDVVKSQAEKPVSDAFYKDVNAYKNGYQNNAKQPYVLLNYNQLKRLDVLVENASKLKKTLIGTLDCFTPKDCCHIGVLYTTHDGKNRYTPLVFPSDIKGNGDDVLDVLQTAIDTARFIEEESSTADIDELYMKQAATSSDESAYSYLDDFRSKDENELLESIYKKTVC